MYTHVATGKDFIIELLEVPSHCKNANSCSFAYNALDGALFSYLSRKEKTLK